jgi:hypothetical protein
LRRHYDEFRARGAEVLALCFDPPERAERYAREQGLPFPLLVDLERRVYRAYGLERGGLWGFLHPRVALGYLPLMLAGRRPQPPHTDPLQLGGDFVVDPAGLLALAQPSRSAADYPTVAELLAAAGEPRAPVRTGD